MALQDMPLSDLDSASSVGNTDLMYLVQSGESKKVTAQTLIGQKADLSNGKLLLAQFPNTSKEVLNDTARFALTTDDVRNGFIVVVSQPTEKMYLVTDETNLDNASGYTAFAADAMWSSIQGKPNNLVVYETSGNVSTLKSEGGTALNPKTTTEALVDENGVSCKDRIAYGEESAPATVEPMSPYVHESDIVNDLATNDPTKPLSAAQGYALNSNLTELFIVKRVTGGGLSYAAGTVGTYAGVVTIQQPQVPANYKAIAFNLFFGHPGVYDAKIYTLGGSSSISVAIYRATASAYTLPDTDIVVDVVYVNTDYIKPN